MEDPVSLESVRPRLIALMREGIEVTQPNNAWFQRMERESVFDGSFDYHSCVIAHWALLVHARCQGDGELERFVLERLSPAQLKAEVKLLADRDRERQITYPYDEAWFGMLLSELARHGSSATEKLEQHRAVVEQRLLAWLEENPFPERVPGSNFCGFYRSWLFTYLLVQLAGPVAEDTPERLESLRLSRIEPARAAIGELQESHEWDFLWLPAILALVDRTAPCAEGDPPPYDPGDPTPLPAEVAISTVHQLGVVLSRLWPSAWDGGRGDAQARERFELGMRSVLEREDLWAEDFATCSHWMPQYLWLGMWFGDGCR